MRDLLLVSHGPLAKSYLASLDMIAGGHTRVQAINFDGEISKEVLGKQIEEAIDSKHQTIIVVDLPGGTPCNVCLEKYMNNQNVEVLASLNLPMLLDIYLNLDNSGYEVTTALQEGHSNCRDLKHLVANNATDDE
ncbi:mannose/fructose/sorbose-specific PTS system IIA component [Lactiplantibacillus paraplantarum]|uniref:Mannose/fructose/sorbose-specific PTS system IIA component n=1 Tax=Lactiplantibacillus paraplantarum TaxID=60520 RepID=A0ABQ0NBU5_9LACO|nr:hypothetical protein [Lactiplantibacillus paraplantarum]GBF02562.1 mannose/fructose/sorbose-specific PTS system IIA component [Lactiplantibacillus paraplantarum]